MELYLGDGLYASWNGYSVKLRAPRLEGDHEVYLDLEMVKRLSEWALGKKDDR